MNDHQDSQQQHTTAAGHDDDVGSTSNQLLTSSSAVSPLEQDVLDEYTRLLKNMNHLSSTLSTLSQGPITLEITEGLRLLERKVASVYTLMKASVYSIVLQQGHLDGSGGGSQDGGGGGGGDGGGYGAYAAPEDEETMR